MSPPNDGSHDAGADQGGPALIDGDLTVPERATGLVVFAHGSGSSRFSGRNRAVAGRSRGAGSPRCCSTC